MLSGKIISVSVPFSYEFVVDIMFEWVTLWLGIHQCVWWLWIKNKEVKTTAPLIFEQKSGPNPLTSCFPFDSLFAICLITTLVHLPSFGCGILYFAWIGKVEPGQLKGRYEGFRCLVARFLFLLPMLIEAEDLLAICLTLHVCRVGQQPYIYTVHDRT